MFDTTGGYDCCSSGAPGFLASSRAPSFEPPARSANTRAISPLANPRYELLDSGTAHEPVPQPS